MKLYEIFNEGGFHTTIITTFGVQFDAFESIVLNRLRGADCRNVVLIGRNQPITNTRSAAQLRARPPTPLCKSDAYRPPHFTPMPVCKSIACCGGAGPLHLLHIRRLAW
jgi:hypothetical protein